MSRVRVSEALANVEGFVCDDCLMVLAGLGSRQAARRIAVLLASAGELSRGRGACSRCGKVKYVTSTSGRPAPHHEHGAGDATSVGVGSRADGPALAAALAAVQRLGVGAELTETIALLESAAVGHHHADISRLLHERGIDQDLLEVVELLSLGAGNTGRDYDLETDRRIAEFKFITWRGGAEAIRQNHTFVDMFNLACADTTKRRVLYLLDADVPRR